MSVDEARVDELNEQLIIDNHGRPKDELTLRIVRLFFSPPFPPPKPSFTVKEVAGLLAADVSKTEAIIRQLTREKIFFEDQQNPGLFRYNYQCPYIEHQAKLEKHLVEEELKRNFTDSNVDFLPFNYN